jgi:hypothetical protein
MGITSLATVSSSDAAVNSVNSLQTDASEFSSFLARLRAPETGIFVAIRKEW